MSVTLATGEDSFHEIIFGAPRPLAPTAYSPLAHVTLTSTGLALTVFPWVARREPAPGAVPRRYGHNGGAVLLQFHAGRQRRHGPHWANPRRSMESFDAHAHRSHRGLCGPLIAATIFQRRRAERSTPSAVPMSHRAGGFTVSCRQFLLHEIDDFLHSGEFPPSATPRIARIARQVRSSRRQTSPSTLRGHGNEPQVVWSSGAVMVSAICATRTLDHVYYRVDKPAGPSGDGGDASSDVLAPPRAASLPCRSRSWRKGRRTSPYIQRFILLRAWTRAARASVCFVIARARLLIVCAHGAACRGAQYRMLTHLISAIGA